MTPSQAYRAALEAAATKMEQLFKQQVFWTLQDAAAAIRALPVPEDADDVVLVPKDPTAEMLEAGKKAWKKPRLHVSYNPADELNTCGVIYRAMINAKE